MQEEACTQGDVRMQADMGATRVATTKDQAKLDNRVSKLQKLGQRPGTILPHSSHEKPALSTPWSWTPSFQTQKFLLFKPPRACGTLLQQPWQTSFMGWAEPLHPPCQAGHDALCLSSVHLLCGLRVVSRGSWFLSHHHYILGAPALWVPGILTNGRGEGECFPLTGPPPLTRMINTVMGASLCKIRRNQALSNRVATFQSLYTGPNCMHMQLPQAYAETTEWSGGRVKDCADRGTAITHFWAANCLSVLCLSIPCQYFSHTFPCAHNTFPFFSPLLAFLATGCVWKRLRMARAGKAVKES